MSLNDLKVKHKISLLELLQKYINMFDWTLYQYIGSTMKIQQNTKPYHDYLFPIPKIHKQTLKKQVNKLV